MLFNMISEISLKISSGLFALTPFAVSPSFSAAFINPYALVPCLSVPADSRIFDIGILSPYCFDIVARHAAPQFYTYVVFKYVH
nr:hypothetical protein [Aceticella autotrophica]